MRANYRPRPIETGTVSLSPELEQLVEKLSESAHDHWAMRRLSEGWVYGPKRDDLEKTHPDLVPYADLSEGEKDYDRTAVRETVKAILALGFAIDPRAANKADE